MYVCCVGVDGCVESQSGKVDSGFINMYTAYPCVHLHDKKCAKFFSLIILFHVIPVR